MATAEIWLDDSSLGSASLAGHLHHATARSGETLRFEYAPDWLRNTPHAFALDPDLPLVPGPLFSPNGAAELTGSFDDCSPDRWGRLLMDRREAIEAREQGRPARSLRAWDYLLGTHDESRMGALRLRDPDRGTWLDDRPLGAPPTTRLRELEAAAAAVERNDTRTISRNVLELVAPGGSLGGARPKAGFRDDDGSLWLAKFPSTEDTRDVALWEGLAHTLAGHVGIVVPPARLMKLSPRGHTFAVRRFDRAPDAGRRAYASAQTLLAMDSEGASYLDLVASIENNGTRDGIATDLEQLFRRACFNILIGNRDDHLRNHGFLRQIGGWRLSPAFDVNPDPGKTAHVLAIDASNPTPDTAILLETAAYYRLKPAAAAGLLDDVRNGVRQWRTLARHLGIAAAEIDLMAATIDPER